MATETLTIFKVDTGAAVENLADLRNNIKILKDELNKLDIGSKEYKDTLNQLETNQAALKNAMHGTATSMEQITAAAKGQDQSYNGLVRTMAKYKEELRAIDISTEEGKKAFEDKAAQIKAVNDQLKDLDALQGNYQRNVGNYEGALSPLVEKFDNLGGILKQFPPTLGAAKEQIGKVGESMQLVGKQPILGIIGLLAPIIMKITEGLKENQTALDAIDKVMKALQPVFDFFEGILEKIAGWLSQAVDYILELASNSGTSFKQIVSGVVGVGNVIVQFLLTPIRNVIDGIKGMGQALQNVFKGQFKQAAQTAKDTIKEIGDNFKNGLDFKGNFEAGKKVGEQFAAGLKSSKKKAGDAAKEVKEEVEKNLLMTWDDLEAEAQRRAGLLAEAREMEKKNTDDFTAFLDEQNEAQLESVTAMLDAQLDAEWKAMEEEKRIQKQRMDTFMAFSDTLGSVFSAVADIYEADAEADEEAAKKSKALRTAAAIVSTISGAISAFMSTWKAEELPLSVKAVLAPVNAASVLAAGYAQVKQINAVKVGNSTGASVAAPSFSPQIANVRQVTGQNEQLLLNQKQRVYLVYSDLQVANTNQRVKVQETEF